MTSAQIEIKNKSQSFRLWHVIAECVCTFICGIVAICHFSNGKDKAFFDEKRAAVVLCRCEVHISIYEKSVTLNKTNKIE